MGTVQAKRALADAGHIKGNGMTSYQRLALFVFFDALERDLVGVIRSVAGEDDVLTEDEKKGANIALSHQLASPLDPSSPFDQLLGLDLGTKFQVLMRLKAKLDNASAEYYRKLQPAIERNIVVRNAVMHGRPLTIEEYASGFAFAQELKKQPRRWPQFYKDYIEYAKNPDQYSSRAVGLLDQPGDFGVLNNLPRPDYDDTGFFPRPDIEKSLKRKILGRHPVITILGDGGNGKTAVALQTLYGMVESNDHDFDLILWYSAKVAALSIEGVKVIESALTASPAIISQAAELEPGDGDPMTRLRRLLTQNKVLLVIDNLETVTGGLIRELVEDIPGESKLLLTSRIPVGGDLPVNVNEFSEAESIRFLRIVIEAHGVSSLKALDNGRLKFYAGRLGFKPLLLKWFVLGVKSGLDPNKIVVDQKHALQFCLENVVDKLGSPAKFVCVILATLPEAISISILVEISKKSALLVEEGISELVRFGLVTTEDTLGIDQHFKLRSFVRSYIIRVINPDKNDTNEISSSYLRLKNAYEQERMQAQANRYQIRNLIVRSPSEAIAAQKLRRTVHYSLTNGWVDEDLFKELKVTNPAYFEVYRNEGVAAYYSSDVPRAIHSYEAALEYGNDQPQLHYFFAGLLMRSGYTERAAEEYAKALELDPEEPVVLREAARNLFRLHNYDLARKYLDKAAKQRASSQKDMVVLLDLQIQLRVRLIEHKTSVGDFDSAVDGCSDLLSYLQTCEVRLFDKTIIDHIRWINGTLAVIKRNCRRDTEKIDLLSNWIEEHAALDRAGAAGSPTGQRVGKVKRSGLKPTFGFIQDSDENEFFVAAARTDPEVWRWLNEGGLVLFEEEASERGPLAVNIVKYERNDSDGP